MSTAEDNLKALARLIFDKSGLANSLNVIANDVEEQLAGEYEAIDDEEDEPITPSYGGLCYTTYYLMDDGKIVRRVDRNLTDSQRELIKRIAEDGNLSISVCRDDWFKHEYSFSISVPMSPTVSDSDRLPIYVEIKFSIHNTRDVTLSASTEDEVGDNEVSKALMLYTLAY